MSADFEIAETKKFVDSYEKILGAQAGIIYSKIRNVVYPQLRKMPFFGKNIKKLKDHSPATWRYRLGDYRLFYGVSVEQKIVIIASIRHRKDAYRP